MTITCPHCRHRSSLHARLPFLCACGARLLESGEVLPPTPCRTDADLPAIAAICLACPHLRDHERAGLRCAHRNCHCGQGEQATVDIAGRRFNGGLARRMQAGRCPDGRW